MMDYVFRKNDIAWLKMWMLLFVMISIYVNNHEGGRNRDKKDEGESLRDSINTS
jgi:hypothetical protein